MLIQLAEDLRGYVYDVFVTRFDAWLVFGILAQAVFGARFVVPGTGMIPNNYMYLFTPHPGRANSVAPGKRVTSSMSPVIVLRGDRPVAALGLHRAWDRTPLVNASLVPPTT